MITIDSELIIQNGKKYYCPAVLEGIEWSTERIGAPGQLTFKILEDKKLKISEGNAVRFKYKGKKVFYGFIFSRQTDGGGEISVTAYDQLRYLKNKETYVYENKTLTEVVKKIITDFSLREGRLEDTKYKIPSRVEDNQTLFDIIANAQDITMMNKGKMYVLYDDFGKIALKDISNMKVDIVIDKTTGQKYNYSSSIDSETYNQIKLYYDNKETKEREIYIAKSTKNINSWGVLQYYEKLQDGENGQVKADTLLKLYNARKKTLNITKAIGDYRVRAGSMVVVSLVLDNKKVLSYMLVEKCKHIYNDREHWMDLTLRGGDFSV